MSLKENRVLDIVSDNECATDNQFDDARVVESGDACYVIGINFMFAKIFVYKIGEELEHKRSLWKEVDLGDLGAQEQVMQLLQDISLEESTGGSPQKQSSLVAQEAYNINLIYDTWVTENGYLVLNYRNFIVKGFEIQKLVALYESSAVSNAEKIQESFEIRHLLDQKVKHAGFLDGQFFLVCERQILVYQITDEMKEGLQTGDKQDFIEPNEHELGNDLGDKLLYCYHKQNQLFVMTHNNCLM